MRPDPEGEAMRPRSLRRLLTGLLLAALCTVLTASATAQGSTSLGIWGGMFSPLGHDPDLGSVGTSVERQNSLAVGGRLTYWGANILGVELVGGYSPARTRVADAVVNQDRNLSQFVAGLKLMVGLSPALSPIGFHVGAGPALIRNGHDVTDPNRSDTKLGAVVGGGIRLPVSAHLAVRADAEDYIHKGSFERDRSTQNDLFVTAGLSIH
jgi:Outer membrane protein beta-barrel domain